MTIIEELIKLVAGKLRSAGLLLELFKLEAKLASLSLMPLLMYFIILGLAVMALWITAVSFIGYLIYYFSDNLLIALSSVFLLHIILCAVLIKVILINFNRMSFEKTRELLFKQTQDVDFTDNSEDFSKNKNTTDYNEKVKSIKSVSEKKDKAKQAESTTLNKGKSQRDNHEQKTQTRTKHKITRRKNTSGTKRDT